MIVPITGGFVVVDDATGQTLTLKNEGSSIYSADMNIRSGGVELVDPNTPTRKVTVKDESAQYAGVNSLDVNIRSGIVQVKLSGENLRYEELSKDVALTNGSWDTVYNRTTDIGKIIWVMMRFTNNNVDIKVTVDGNVIIDTINLNELYSDYELDVGTLPNAPDFIHTFKQGKGVMLSFPGGLEFETSFKIEVRANGINYKMARGLVVRALT